MMNHCTISNDAVEWSVTPAVSNSGETASLELSERERDFLLSLNEIVEELLPGNPGLAECPELPERLLNCAPHNSLHLYVAE